MTKLMSTNKANRPSRASTQCCSCNFQRVCLLCRKETTHSLTHSLGMADSFKSADNWRH